MQQGAIVKTNNTLSTGLPRDYETKILSLEDGIIRILKPDGEVGEYLSQLFDEVIEKEITVGALVEIKNSEVNPHRISMVEGDCVYSYYRDAINKNTWNEHMYSKDSCIVLEEAIEFKVGDQVVINTPKEGGRFGGYSTGDVGTIMGTSSSRYTVNFEQPNSDGYNRNSYGVAKWECEPVDEEYKERIAEERRLREEEEERKRQEELERQRLEELARQRELEIIAIRPHKPKYQKPTINLSIRAALQYYNNYFDSFDGTIREEQLDIIHYIHKMSIQLDKNIYNENLFDIFPNNNNVLITSEEEVNSILINYEVKDDDYELSKHDIAKLEEINKQFIDKRISQVDSHINSAKVSIDKYQRYLDDYYAKLHEQIKERRLIEKSTTDDKLGPLKDALENSKFSFYDIDTTYVYFVNKEDIFCLNKASGIDIKVNMGKFKMRISLNNFSIKVFDHTNNIYCDNGYYHPHIDSGGSPCWGNLDRLYQEAREDADINLILNLIYKLLTNYNPGSPYSELDNFAKRSGQLQPDGTRCDLESSEPEYITAYCPDCGHDNGEHIEGHEVECSNCEHWFEVYS